MGKAIGIHLLALVRIQAVGSLLLAICCLCLSSSVQAAKEPFELWNARIDTVIPDTPHTFHFGTSAAGFIDFPVVVNTGADYTASSGANVAALIAEMTNGVDDGLQFMTPSFDYTVPESHLFTIQGPPVGGFSGVQQLWGPIDLQGMTITSFRIAVGRNTSGSLSRYAVHVFGYAPEPSSAVLLLAAVTIQGSFLRRRPY